MRAGQLRQGIRLEQPTSTLDTNTGGQVAGTPTFTDRISASVEPLSTRERLGAGGVQNDATHIVRFRYRRGVTPATRVLFGTRRFEIIGITNVGERNRELELLCAERV